MRSFYFRFTAKGVLSAFIAIAARGVGRAGEHSWIMPGQCTPPELSTRRMLGTMDPQLEEQDKIVLDMKGGRLVMELETVKSESLTVGWMWIAPEKILSGTSVFPKSSDSFVLAGAEDSALKSLKFRCSFNRQAKRLSLHLGYDSPRYALVSTQGGQTGGDHPAAAPKSQPEALEKPQPESKVAPR